MKSAFCGSLTGPLLLIAALPLFGETITERWGQGKACPRKGMELLRRPDKTAVLKFDLSALPTRTRIYRASLRVSITGPPAQPILIYPLRNGAADKGLLPDAKPLELESPWRRSFDALRVVREWVSAGEAVTDPAVS